MGQQILRGDPVGVPVRDRRDQQLVRAGHGLQPGQRVGDRRRTADEAGVDPVGGSPEQLAQALKSETARVTDAAGRAQLKAE